MGETPILEQWNYNKKISKSKQISTLRPGIEDSEEDPKYVWDKAPQRKGLNNPTWLYPNHAIFFKPWELGKENYSHAPPYYFEFSSQEFWKRETQNKFHPHPMMEVTAHNPKKDTWDVKLFTVCIWRVEECEQKNVEKERLQKINPSKCHRIPVLRGWTKMFKNNLLSKNISLVRSLKSLWLKQFLFQFKVFLFRNSHPFEI